MKTKRTRLIEEAIENLQQAAKNFTQGRHGVNRIALYGKLQFAATEAREVGVKDDILNAIVTEAILREK